MSSFQIHESTIELFYVFNVTVNLYDGTLIPRQITSDKEDIVKKIPMTNTSEFIFPSTDTGEGFIQVWYIVSEDNKAYSFVVGTINSTPIKVGGYIGIVEKTSANQNVIEKHIKSNVKHWADLYSKKEVVLLINEMNNLHGNIQKLM